MIVAGNGKPGNSTVQLNIPRGIYLRQSSNELYIADTQNNRIQMFVLNQPSTQGITIASTKGSPRRIFIDEDNGTTMYVTFWSTNRVEKWDVEKKKGKLVGDICRYCEGIGMDRKKNIYMTEYLDNRLMKHSSENGLTEIVIDGDLADPRGIYVDQNDGSIYVAECLNHRIFKWFPDVKQGITVTGSSMKTLDCPNSVLVDEETGVMYITEGVENRVQRWFINASEGEIIIGGDGKIIGILKLIFLSIEIDLSKHQGKLTDLAFDQMGNLYVSDSKNHQVKMFALIDNRQCNEISPGNSTNSDHFHRIFLLRFSINEHFIPLVNSLSSHHHPSLNYPTRIFSFGVVRLSKIFIFI